MQFVKCTEVSLFDRYWPLEGGLWDLIMVPYVTLVRHRKLHTIEHTADNLDNQNKENSVNE